MKIYQVGGAVRDKLLGRKPGDVDYVVVGATPELKKKQGFIEVGKGFPVFLHPLTKEEYALARREIKTGPRHTDFKFIFDETISLKDDLKRRDFTCNAIALDPQTDEYFDYFGGRADIKRHLLRHVDENHFGEDPLRVLRLCRFAAQLNFDAAVETVALCRQMTATGMLDYLTPERIWNEVLKALCTDGFERFVTFAYKTGAFDVIFPEGKEIGGQSEADASGNQLMTALKTAKKQPPLVKFAVLLYYVCHVGEDSAPALPGRHDTPSAVLIRRLCRRLKVPMQFRDFALLAVAKVKKFDQIEQAEPEELYDLATVLAYKHTDYSEDYIEVCRAVRATTEEKNSAQNNGDFEQKASVLRFAMKTLVGIKAADMPGFEQMMPGKNIGECLRQYKIGILKNRLPTFYKKNTAG